MSDETTADRLKEGDQRMDNLQGQIDSLRTAIDENTALTQKVHESTAGLVEILEALRGGMRVIEFLGRVARPVGYIVAAGTAILSAYKATRWGIGR